MFFILKSLLYFLIGPFFIIIAAGLSAGENLAFPPEGLSLKWYWAVFEVESFRESFALSMFLAVFGTLTALVLGVPAAYALSRYRLPLLRRSNRSLQPQSLFRGSLVGLDCCVTW